MQVNSTLSRVSLTDQVAEIICLRLANGELRPGDHLTEKSLAEQLQVSRTPVREALQRLTTLGLLTHDAHRGSRVATLTLAQLCQVYEVRERLEGLAAGLFAVRASPEARRVLREIWAELQHARAVGDQAAIRRHDFRLHRHLLRAAGNEFLGGGGHAEALMLLAFLRREPWPVLTAPAGAGVADDPHADLMAAVVRHDGPAAEAAMRRHISRSYDHLVQQLRREQQETTSPGLPRTHEV